MNRDYYCLTRQGNYFSYKPGDIIQDRCKPFMKSLAVTEKGKRCDNCFALKKKLTKCTGCRRMFYCNRKCQMEDWAAAHQHECGSKAFKNYAGKNTELVFQLFRMWATLKNPNNADKPCKLYDGTSRSFNNLPSHASKHIVKPNLIEEGRSLVTEFSKEDPSVTLELFVNYYGTLQTNGFCILDEDETGFIGIGIYIEASVFKHSCKPTAIFTFRGSEMQIRAIGPIPRGDKPTIAYMAICADRVQRKKLLLERYHFECKCIMCENNLDKGVEYEMINEILKMFENTDEKSDVSWPLLLNFHTLLIPVLQSIYHRYDEHITDQFKRITEFGFKEIEASWKSGHLPYYINELFKEVSELTLETEYRLSITYGTDHCDYKDFIAGLSPDMRKLVKNMKKNQEREMNSDLYEA